MHVLCTENSKAKHDSTLIKLKNPDQMNGNQFYEIQVPKIAMVPNGDKMLLSPVIQCKYYYK